MKAQGRFILPFPMSAVPMRRCRRKRPVLRPASAAGAGSLHGAARQRVFAARRPATARPVLHHRRARSRRRRGASGDRRPRWPDRALRAGLSRCRRGGGLWPGGSAAGQRGRGPPRPPASVPHVASRTPAVPLPKAMPLRPGEPATAAKTQDKAASEPAKPSEPAPQSVAQAKPVAATPPATPPAVIEAKPPVQIQPTKEMPKVQGLE